MGRASHVKVFVRTRPTARPYEGFRVHKDGESITVSFPKEEASGLINNQLDSLTFKFDGVLENVSQDAVYGAAAQEAVDAVLQGYNATVFCYGQTGSGKTFTMCGDARNYHHRGIIPRALHHVFREIDMRPDRTYKATVSYLEIYNEALYDLLSDAPGASSEGLAVMDDAPAGGGSNVRGLTQVAVSGEEEALAQFFSGEQGRSTARHMLNAASSRSHALFSVALEMRTSDDAAERAVVSRLTLVDLAGSERTKATGASGEAMREAACINKSLSFLEQVVGALARKDAHVPFRQTKLTAVLKDALGGNCATVMVANLWPEAAHLESCVSTLRFASRVRTLVTEAVVNESSDPALLVKRYERQVRELKQELAMRDMLSGRGHVSYDDLSEGEARELRQLVEDYIAGRATLEQLPTESLKRIRETYKAFKAAAASTAAAAAVAAPAQMQQQVAGQGAAPGAEEAGLLGDVDPASQGGFLLGTAPLNARPAAGSPTAAAGSPKAGGGGGNGSLRVAVAGAGAGAAAGVGRRSPPAAALSPEDSETASPRSFASGLEAPGGASGTGGGGPLDLNTLFVKWKGGPCEGQRLAAAVRERQQQLADLKRGVKDAAARVNASKVDIDELSRRADGRRAAAGSPLGGQAAAGSASAWQPGDGGCEADGGGVLDGEQYELGRELRAAKARYRADFDRLKSLRAAAGTSAAALAAARRAQLDGFEAWRAARGLAPGAPGATGRIGAFRGAGGGGDEDADDEELDPAETFERLQMARIMQSNPDSGAFHAALKRTGAPGGSGGGAGGGKVSAATAARAGTLRGR